ncbi:MAG: biotin--[acetyl-CoA-carboxylase] ligase [Candidatus Hydrothermota bacterium]|nr:MAG: biotin--[acetyl-CoA-carboxylase] ligase [Candidatus Hydrothermae bacterium]
MEEADMLKIFRRAKIDSTNEEAWRLLKAGVTPPFVVVAEEQEAGKGRFGRSWYSPKGGLWFSIATQTMRPSETISLAAAYAVIHTVKEITDICARVRIPNDVVIERKKLAGILIERDENTVVAGIGLNLKVERFPSELKDTAISLHKVTSKPLNPHEFLKKISEKFLRCVETGDFTVGMWLCCLGKKVEFWVGDTHLVGKFLGILENKKAVFDLDGKELEIPLAQINKFRKFEEGQKQG